MTLGYGWERGREARQADSMLGVGNPQRPEAIPQFKDDNPCFQMFSEFTKERNSVHNCGRGIYLL